MISRATTPRRGRPGPAGFCGGAGLAQIDVDLRAGLVVEDEDVVRRAAGQAFANGAGHLGARPREENLVAGEGREVVHEVVLPFG